MFCVLKHPPIEVYIVFLSSFVELDIEQFEETIVKFCAKIAFKTCFLITPLLNCSWLIVMFEFVFSKWNKSLAFYIKLKILIKLKLCLINLKKMNNFVMILKHLVSWYKKKEGNPMSDFEILYKMSNSPYKNNYYWLSYFFLTSSKNYWNSLKS